MTGKSTFSLARAKEWWPVGEIEPYHLTYTSMSSQSKGRRSVKSLLTVSDNDELEAQRGA